MAEWLIEEEAGTVVVPGRKHNGYWAGDFSTNPSRVDLPAWFRWGLAEARKQATQVQGPRRAAA